MSPDLHPGVESVVALVRQHCQVAKPVAVPLAEALHRILAQAVYAPEDLPAYDRSAMDGYAVRLEDRQASFQVVDYIRAGEWKPQVLQSGEAVQVATGAALPGQDLQVIMKEAVSRSGDTILVKQRTTERHIRFCGEDAKKGQPLAAAGACLSPGALALLASLGESHPLVVRLPKVLHVATGNELVGTEQTPAAGQIRDSNSVLVRAFLQQYHVEPEQHRLPEDEAMARAWLESKISSQTDLLLISGGASVGEHDFTARLLRFLGYTVHLCKTNTRPGKPLIFGTRGQAVAFGLPGNPLAHFVCLNLYVRAALEKISGWPERPVYLAGRLASALAPDLSSRETLWPARMTWAPAGPELVPLRWSSSGDLTCLAVANALLRVPANSSNLEAGSAVQWAPTSMIS